MEVILSTAFGRAVDVQGGKGGKIFEAALAVFNAFVPPEKENSGSLLIKVLQFLPCKLFAGFAICGVLTLHAECCFVYYSMRLLDYSIKTI